MDEETGRATGPYRLRTVRLAVAFVLALGVVLTATPAGAAPRDGHDHRNLVVLTGRAVVAAGERLDRVVIFDGPARVDGMVRHRVIAFNGDVTISGRVGGDVTAFNGRVVVLGGGRVDGRVVSQEPARIAPSATVRGGVERVRTRWMLGVFVVLARGVLWLAVSASTLLLGALLLLLAPRAVKAIADAGRSAVGPTIAWGLALAAGLPLIGILLLASVLGLPFGIGLLGSLTLLYPFGYVVGALLLGWFAVRAGTSPWLALLIGWGILRVAALTPWLALFTWLAATIYGLGAVAIAVWRSRSRRPITPRSTEAPPAPVPSMVE